MFDGKAFGQEIVEVVKAHLDKTLAPIIGRLGEIEKALAEVATTGDVDALRSEVDGVRKALAELPAPESPALPDIAAMVSEAVSAIPPAEPGKSLSVDDVRPLIEEAVQRAVSSIPAPKDGSGIKELLIDRDGNLVATMDDGRMKELGRVVGKDAVPLDLDAVERSIVEAVKAMPKPKDGEDGIGFDDMSCEIREDGVYLVWEKGEVIKEARLPVPIDRGVWKQGPYKRGEAVTWGGSFWIAQEDTSEKPDTGKGWRLAVKKGRDGKDKA